MKCTSTGRKCEYVEPPPIKKRTPSSIYSAAPKSLSLYNPSPEASGTVNERRGFQYFRSRVVQDISGCFELDFWDHLVLQVSHAEPTVHHAMLALSSLYEAYESSRMNHTDIVGSQAERPLSFALQQYTKAVGLLASNIATEQPSFQAILISCLIFVWIEFVQSNLDTALHHLQSGLQILKDSRQSPDLQQIGASLPRLFRRLHTQARIHGSPSSDFNSTTSEKQLQVDITNATPYTFSTIFEARDCLDHVLDAIFRWIRQIYNPDFFKSTMERHPFPDPLSLEAIRQLHLHDLQIWQEAYENTPLLFNAPPGATHSAGAQLLELQCTATLIILRSLLEPSEMVFDGFTPEFERILSLSERLIQNTQLRGGLMLSFDIGIIAPLSMVALKCRWPGTRRRAIALLKLAPEREGMWHRDNVVQFAEWKVEVEERGHDWASLETNPLPESARIHNEQMREAVLEGQQVTILRFKRGPIDRSGDREFEEEVTGLNASMGQVI